MRYAATRARLAEDSPRRPDVVRRRLAALSVLCATVLILALPADAAAQYAGLSGIVRDTQGGVVAEAALTLVDQATGVGWSTQSNKQGIYVFAAVRPATYQLTAEAPGFAGVTQNDVTLHVDERTALDVTLSVAQQTEAVEVTGRRGVLGTADGSVGTVIDQAFAARLPTRGRSFSALVALAPGVVRSSSASASTSGSEFAVNGQRDTSNSLLVDGVSGLTELGQAGMGAGVGNRFSSTQTGTVNGGVSLDAVQEIRVQTSTFAAEFGRTPGAQISLITRSGTNRFTGSAFGQFRNDGLMANDWFANSQGVAKAETREHQFGGTLGGPVMRGRLFFFASYEGLRLDRPNFQTTAVPSLEARERPSVIRDVLNLYPQPTGPSAMPLVAQNAAYVRRRSSSDTLGVRMDAAVTPRLQVFGRYARTPSSQRNGNAPFVISSQDRDAHAMSGGLTATIGSRALLDVRGNWGQADFEIDSVLEGLRPWFPATIPTGGRVAFSVSGLTSLSDGGASRNSQRQGNLLGSLSYLWGSHQLKTGIDYRRVAPRIEGEYSMTAQFQNLQRALQAGTADVVGISRAFPIHATFQNLSWYAQDLWRAHERLSLTYGLRWDINPTPRFAEGEGPLAAKTFEPIASLTMETQQNVPLWKTRYGNVFPRFGASYALDGHSNTVLSGGIGIFGDLEGAAVGSVELASRVNRESVPLPLSSGDVIDVAAPSLVPPLAFFATVPDPHLRTPRTTQWNVAMQRALSTRQAVSVTYVGAHGTRLLQTRQYGTGATSAFAGSFFAVAATGRSRYESVQFQYRGRMRAGLSVLGAYALGESRDTTSSIGATDVAEGLAPAANDVRHAGSVAVAWQLPGTQHRTIGWLVNDWSLDVMATARSAYPLTIRGSRLSLPGTEQVVVRASQVPGVPVTIDDPDAPGGWRFNADAFVDPLPGEQGNTGRNAFRGFSSKLVDLALQRSVTLPGRAKVRVRVEVFNLFNTPTFLDPYSMLGPFFGKTLATSAVGLVALYQPGGARSAAVSVRVQF